MKYRLVEQWDETDNPLTSRVSYIVEKEVEILSFVWIKKFPFFDLVPKKIWAKVNSHYTEYSAQREISRLLYTKEVGTRKILKEYE